MRTFYPAPWRFRKSPGEMVQSFSVTFVFGMVPMDPIYSDECTDGMTFLISPTKDFSGAQHSQYLGLLNKTSDGKASSHIFAVELDSSQNTEFNSMTLMTTTSASTSTVSPHFSPDQPPSMMTRMVNSKSCPLLVAKRCKFGWTIMERPHRST